MRKDSVMNRHKDAFTFGLLGIIGALAGCALEPKTDSAEPPDDPLDRLDPVALAMAIKNQDKLEAAGLQLVGRAWFGADAYGEIYDDPESSLLGSAETVVQHQNAQVLTFTARGTSELAGRADLRPQAGETFGAYVARTSRGQIQARFDPRSRNREAFGTDVLVFGSSAISQSGDLGSTQQALSNESCPLSSFNAQCSHNYGYFGAFSRDVPVNSWYVTDRGTTSFSGTGTSGYGVVCADLGDATLTINRGGSVVITIDIAQGFFNWAAAWSGWSENEYCSSSFIICLAHRWRISFGRTSYSINMTPHSGIAPIFANGHFCGSIRNIGDYTDDVECSEARTCPGTGFVN